MSQLSFLGESAPIQPDSPSKKLRLQQPQAATAPKRIASANQTKVTQPKGQPEPALPEPAPPDLKPAPYGLCRVCGRAIALPGLDASLCSNSARTCGSSGWVVDPVWLAVNSPRSQGGAA